MNFSTVKEHRAMYLEVEENPNCPESVFARFREHGARRQVKRLRVSDRVSSGEWCLVTGLSEEAGTLCPVWAQQVEDSGAGLVWLVWGGLWGIRMKPADSDEPWDVENQRQWGEPYLQLADARDIEFDEGAGIKAHSGESEFSS